MRIERLRSRFLVAMGLTAGWGCSKGKSDTPIVAVPSASAVTTNETPTATATATETATATADAAPPPPSATVAVATPEGGIGGSRVPFHGGCGFTIECKPEKAGQKNAAPKPYEKCAATIAAVNDGDLPPHGEGTFDPEITKTRRAQNATLCCYKAPRTLCGGGRPLRTVDDAPILAGSASRNDWIDRELASTSARRDLDAAARWKHEAATEHASVASFARASLQLLALGAPPDLVAGAHRAALDEIEHARTCFALATRRGDAPVGPGPLAIDRAPFATTIQAFVRDTFLDGCWGETAAALDVRMRAEAGDEVENAALSKIADDEEAHAELAWRMLAWAVATGGDAARGALRDAMAEIAERDDRVVDLLVVPCAQALLS